MYYRLIVRQLARDKRPLKHYVFYLIAIYGGLRRGETGGLRWGDIDFENNEIHINRTACYSKKYGTYTNSPKTRGSKRIVAFPNGVMAVLKMFQTEQLNERLKLGDAWHGETELSKMWLFTNSNGQIMHTGMFQLWTTYDCKSAGIRRASPHSFRHLNASLMIQSGEDVATVSACLGQA